MKANKQNKQAVNRVAKVTAAHHKTLPSTQMTENQVTNAALREQHKRRQRMNAG